MERVNDLKWIIHKENYETFVIIYFGKKKIKVLMDYTQFKKFKELNLAWSTSGNRIRGYKLDKNKIAKAYYLHRLLFDLKKDERLHFKNKNSNDLRKSNVIVNKKWVLNLLEKKRSDKPAVCWCTTKELWKAYICREDRKKEHIGYYEDYDEAKFAYETTKNFYLDNYLR